MSDKHIIVAPYNLNKEGNGKALTFEADMTKPGDREFASDLEEVAATKPTSLQEFLSRLVDHQNKKKTE